MKINFGKQKKRYGMMSRILMQFALILISAIFILSLIFINKSYKTIEKETILFLKREAKDKAEIIEQKINSIFRVLNIFAEAKTIRNENLSLKEKSLYLKNELKEHFGEDCLDILISEKNGNTINLQGEEFDSSACNWFKESIAGNIYVTEPDKSCNEHKTVSCFSVPVFSSKTAKETKRQADGVLTVVFDGNILNKMISGLKTGTNGSCFIVGNSGSVIAHTECLSIDNIADSIKVINKNINSADIVSIVRRKAQANTVGYGTYIYNGIKKEAAYTNIKTVNWILVSSIPKSEFMSKIWNLLETFTVVVIVILLTSIIGSIIVAKKIVNPIKKTANQLKKLALGHTNNSAEINVDTNDELSDIAIYFQDAVKNAELSKRSQIECSNINKMFEAVRKTIQCVNANNSFAYMLYMDIDKFRTITDVWGYPAGEELIRLVSKRISACVSGEDVFMHVKGDEFMIIHFGSSDSACSLAKKILDNTYLPFHWENKEFTTCLSAGIVPITPNTKNAHDIILSAAKAASSAFAEGGNTYKLLDVKDTFAFNRENTKFWLTAIQTAVLENNFVLYKQGIYSLKPGFNDKKYEILIRLKKDDGSIISPINFIPVAEEYNMIYLIDRWVIKKSFEAYAELVNENHPDSEAVFSINLSGNSIFYTDIIDYIVSTKEKYDIPSHNFCFEITESAAIKNLDAATKFVSILRMHGFKFALDDFGVGFSSFPYLKKLPIDLVKIDGSFIRNIDKDYIDLAMVKAMCSMCKNLGLQTVGEFVETQDVVNILRDIGLDYAQGYTFSQPVPLKDVI